MHENEFDHEQEPPKFLVVPEEFSSLIIAFQQNPALREIVQPMYPAPTSICN